MTKKPALSEWFRRILSFDVLNAPARFYEEKIRPNLFFLFVTALLVLTAYGFSAFNLMLTGDDWEAIHNRNYQHDWQISIGRWLSLILWRVFADNRFVPPFSLFTAASLLSLSAWLMTRSIGLREIRSKFVFVLLFIFFPIWAEPLSFKMAHIPISVSVLLGTLFGVLTVRAARLLLAGEKSVRRISFPLMAAAVFFALSAACYQPGVLFGMMLAAGVLLNELLHDKGTVSLLRIFKAFGVAVPAALVTGAVFYYASVKLSLALTGVPEQADGQYALFNSIRNTGASYAAGLGTVLGYLHHFFFRAQHLFPAAAKHIFLLILLAFNGVVIAKAVRKGSLKSGLAFFVAAAALQGLLFLVPWTVSILREPPKFRYNALIALACLYPIVFSMILEHAAKPLLRSLAIVLASGLIVIFIFQQNVAALSTYTTNQRDLAVAGRLLDRLEQHPDYRRLTADGVYDILLIGTLRLKQDRPFAPVYHPGRMENSAVLRGVFNSQPRRLGHLLRLIESERAVRRILTWPDVPDDLKTKVKAKLPDAGLWPDPSCIFTVDDTFVVVMQR